MKKIFLALTLAVLSTGFSVSGSTHIVRNAYALAELESEGCTKNLAAFNTFLRVYARSHNGNLPAGNNFAGLKELGASGANYMNFACAGAKSKKARSNAELSEANNPFVYFGGMNLERAARVSPNIPLMCDKPGGKHLNVLFVDGRVARIDIQRSKRKISNHRDIVEMLNDTYNYPPEVLESLRLKAGAMDKQR